MFRDVPECSGMFHVHAFIDDRSIRGQSVEGAWIVRGTCVEAACNYTRVKLIDLVVTRICV